MIKCEPCCFLLQSLFDDTSSVAFYLNINCHVMTVSGIQLLSNIVKMSRHFVINMLTRWHCSCLSLKQYISWWRFHIAQYLCFSLSAAIQYLNTFVNVVRTPRRVDNKTPRVLKSTRLFLRVQASCQRASLTVFRQFESVSNVILSQNKQYFHWKMFGPNECV